MYLQSSMNALQRRLDIQRTGLFDEFREAEERFKLRRHRVQERRSKDVHSLHVGERQLIPFLPIYSTVSRVIIGRLPRHAPWFFQTKASRSLTSISSRTRSLKPLSVAKVLWIVRLQVLVVRRKDAYLKVSLRIFSLTSHGPLSTYCRNVDAEHSFMPSNSFHIRGLRVGSYQVRYQHDELPGCKQRVLLLLVSLPQVLDL